MVRRSSAVVAALALSAALGACDAIIGIPDRKLGVHLSCDESKCVCTDGYADCDGDPSDGCEVLLATSVEHCGACGHACNNGTCDDGACECKKGFIDCDGSPKNGCEAEIATDPDNCGTCGHGCLGGSCKGGRCQPFELQTFSYPQSITLVGGFLYVAVCSAPNADPILRIPTAGGDPLAFSTGVYCGIFQSLSGSTIYWASGDTVYSNALDKPAAPMPIATAALPVKSFGASKTHVYWATNDKNTMQGGVYRAALPAGAPESISSEPPAGLAVDDTFAYFSDAAGLHRVAHTDTAVTDVPGAPAPSSLMADGGTLYVMDLTMDASGIIAIPQPSGPAKMIAPGAGTFAMAVHEGKLYWLDYLDGFLWELSLADGTKTPLADGYGYANNSDLAFDDKAIYWLSDQSVYKLAK